MMLLSGLCCSCGCNNTGYSGESGEKVTPATTEISGRRIFEKYCAACHGRDGAAGIGGAANLQQLTLDSAGIRDVLMNGRGFMPAFHNTLTPKEIDNMIQFVQTRSGK